MPLADWSHTMIPAGQSAVKVAVLDDDEDTAASIAAILNREGLHALAFSDARSLEAAAERQKFDAFVIDWLLGDGTAAALTQMLRTSPLTANAPIFLLSGNLAVGGVPSDPSLASAIGRFGLTYRCKPYSSVRLAKELMKATRGNSE